MVSGFGDRKCNNSLNLDVGSRISVTVHKLVVAYLVTVHGSFHNQWHVVAGQ